MLQDSNENVVGVFMMVHEINPTLQPPLAGFYMQVSPHVPQVIDIPLVSMVIQIEKGISLGCFVRLALGLSLGLWNLWGFLRCYSVGIGLLGILHGPAPQEESLRAILLSWDSSKNLIDFAIFWTQFDNMDGSPCSKH